MEYNMEEKDIPNLDEYPLVKIEVGKSYEVSCRFKKSVIEREFFENDYSKDITERERVFCETLWRNSTWLITPQDEDEVEELERAQRQDHSEYMEPNSFEENEMWDTFDGCSFDVYFAQTQLDEDAQEEFKDELYDEGVSWFFDNGWDSYDCEYEFYGPIIVVEK